MLRRAGVDRQSDSGEASTVEWNGPDSIFMRTQIEFLEAGSLLHDASRIGFSDATASQQAVTGSLHSACKAPVSWRRKGPVREDPPSRRTSIQVAMQAIVGAALQQRILVLILSVALIAGGLFAYKQLNIEAYPDPVPPLVDIVTQNPGQSSEEIERYITIPIEVQMAGLPFVTSIRTISLTGLSDVKVQFTYDVTYPRSLAAGDQPPVAARTAAQRRAALHLADQPDRRDLPLPRGRPAGLQRDRPQDHPGLDPAAPPEVGAGRDRRHDLGRQEQDLRHHRRPRQAAGLRPHAEAGARRAERRQHQCRRQHGQSRPAVGGDPQRRPDPHRWPISATPC